MNMFRKKNKVKDDDFIASLPTENGTSSKASRAMTKKNKKIEIEIEERPVFNLESALPKSDDFRTSLIMTTLSTRFSMLREQDDPNTKVGKASDDSVLFPKRASRLNLFSHNQLDDIAEVEPIQTTFRPPFADNGRKGSISDGYGSDDGGSIMNRTRPGEGNNLFGGRQKLYQIPSSSTRDLHSASGMTTGKHTYASDVSISPFQQMRLIEKESRRPESGETPDQEGLHVDADDLDVTQSSLNSFSNNRGTQSSTGSGPSNQRTSTAATSLVSESPVTRQSSNGTVAKVREQDPNSSVESVGFSSSPNLRKKRDEPGRSAFRLSQSRSAANLRETYSRPAPTMSPPLFRGISPPNTISHQVDFVPQNHGKTAFGSPRFQAASPTLPIKSEAEDALTSSLQPSDRGKATAMGLFHKPQKKYDEQQFQQRQRQMHEGRRSPYTVDSRSDSRSSPEFNRTDTQSVSPQPIAASPKPQDRTFTPQIPPIPNGTPSPIFNSHTAQSTTGPQSFSRPRTKSVASTREAAVKARVESLIKRQNAELAALEAAQLGTRPRTTVDYPEASREEDVQQRTFFDNSDASDDERQSRQQSIKSIKSTVSRVLAPTDIHPALRDGTHDFDFETQSTRSSNQPRQSNYSTNSRTNTSLSRQENADHASVLSLDNIDSPTLGPSGLGLSGLIRTHLRNDSDRSSIRPQSSLFPPVPNTRATSTASDPRTATESIKSDPFELENQRNSETEQAVMAAEQTTPPAANLSQKATEILGIATAVRNASEQATPKPPPAKFEEFGHQRNESTETQREQQRFDLDLAERRRKIQDQLKSVQERSRSRSPVGERGVTPNTSHGFMGKLPGKTSPGESHGPSKAMKMLGISGQTRDISQASSRPPRNMWTPEEGRRPDLSLRQDYRASPTQDGDHFGGRYTPNGPNGRPPVRAWTSNENADRPRPPRSTTPSGRQTRNRANSAAAERVPSRNRQYPQSEHEPPIPGRFPGSPSRTSPPSRAPGRRTDSPADRQPSDQRSGSATGQRRELNGYTSPDMFLPPHNGNGFLSRESPRPSPVPTESPRQGPVAMPMSPSMQALPSPNPAFVSNGRTTPTMPGRAAPAGGRKRSIAKGMISDPTFVSSTSSVPLVNLPQNGGPPVEPMFAPPVPEMNPRRRINVQVQSEFSPHPAVRPTGNNLMPMSESRDQGNMLAPNAQSVFDHVLPPADRARLRNRLRKSSSEGGNMAARARQQALADEMAREKDRSPHVAVFPNRSATTLIPHDGGMF